MEALVLDRHARRRAGTAIGGPTGNRAVPRAWCGHSLLLSAVLLALSGAHAAGNGEVIDLLLVAGGGLLLPAWLVWTGRLLRDTSTSQAGNRS